MRIGLIAQSVSEVCKANGLAEITNLVTGGEVDTHVIEGERPDEDTPGPEITETSEPSYYGLDYSRIACLTIPVIQKQARQIQALEAALLALVEQVKALEAGA